MSLKAFHIFFIALSTLLSFGFGVWGVYDFFAYGGVWSLVLGSGSFVIGIVLIFYGINFLHKLKHIGYL
ncbi:MAG: hypothetical protein ACE5G0_04110 [Rhodothermales bacterium]